MQGRPVRRRNGSLRSGAAIQRPTALSIAIVDMVSRPAAQAGVIVIHFAGGRLATRTMRKLWTWRCSIRQAGLEFAWAAPLRSRGPGRPRRHPVADAAFCRMVIETRPLRSAVGCSAGALAVRASTGAQPRDKRAVREGLGSLAPRSGFRRFSTRTVAPAARRLRRFLDDAALLLALGASCGAVV